MAAQMASVESLTPVRRAADTVLALPRLAKRIIAVALDALLCALTVWIAFYLRLDEWVVLSGMQWLAVAIAISFAIPIFIVSGLYRAIFRYSSAAALVTLTQAAVVYGVAYATVITIIQIDTVPRTVGIIQPVLLFLFVGASRVLVSWWLGGAYLQLLSGVSRQPVMIYGAGAAGRQLFHALANSEMRVAGFIDDDDRLHGRTLLGKPIHAPEELPDLVQQWQLTDILLAIPSASRKRRNQILEMVRPLPVAVRTVPGLTHVAQGRVRTSELLELDLGDLLGRPPVAPNEDLLDLKIRGKVVLVTGAGGSIGSELCRQILESAPATLLLLEMSEAALYSIHQELDVRLRQLEQQSALVPLLGSVCDAERIAGIITAWRPDTIYHAAAYKHVPLVEHNPAEGTWNNVFGTLSMAQAAEEGGVADFVLISTDKAVRPTNIMGTTKRLAEMVLQARATQTSTTCFSMVRFGNVLGSSGSVVPLFRKQIQAGGPITITHPDITRYFMTIPEAAQLVIQAGAMAVRSEVFVLDMGEPVKIMDLARRMVELSGLQIRELGRPDGDIEITVTGLRPGEKLYEELLIGNDPTPTMHPRILKARESFLDWSDLASELDLLQRAIEMGDIPTVIMSLRRLVPEYVPESDVVDWVTLQRAG